MARAISLLEVPRANNDLIIRSRETDGSPVSSFATRDWLDLMTFASSTCVSFCSERNIFKLALSFIFNSIYADSSSEKSVWITNIWNMAFLILVSVSFFIYSESFVAIFTDEPDAISIGASWLRIISYSYFICGWWMVSVQAFNGAGDNVTPAKINLVFFWIIQIPLSYFMAKTLDMGYTGVFWAIFISETAVGLFTLWLFSKGKWKRVEV